MRAPSRFAPNLLSNNPSAHRQSSCGLPWPSSEKIFRKSARTPAVRTSSGSRSSHCPSRNHPGGRRKSGHARSGSSGSRYRSRRTVLSCRVRKRRVGRHASRLRAPPAPEPDPPRLARPSRRVSARCLPTGEQSIRLGRGNGGETVVQGLQTWRSSRSGFHFVSRLIEYRNKSSYAK